MCKRVNRIIWYQLIFMNLLKFTYFFYLKSFNFHVSSMDVC